MLELDPLHQSFDLFGDPFVKEVWAKRHKGPHDKNIGDTFNRVADAIYINDAAHIGEGREAMQKGLFCPAGRILLSAGVDTSSTLQNCYVSRTIDDSIEGIGQVLSEAMTTLARFGGIGTDFSTIRPKGAKVGSQGLTSPGVVAWMELWDEASKRVEQAGHRRGGMMSTLDISHPDIYDFINAKHTKGVLSNCNVSVLVSDAFMQAVKDDNVWHLEFGQGMDRYRYKIVNARDLWNDIMRSTHEFSEPGVIFIDRVNRENNLSYCENIRCTNPCGEQPLPPFGACNLGHINLARIVDRPFTTKASINFLLIKEVVKIAVRFLDNVISASKFPIQEQWDEQDDKRRIGLGVTGLADMLMQMGVPYNSAQALNIVDNVMDYISYQTYWSSIELAKERGAFSLFDKTKYAKQGFASRMPVEVLHGINEHGIRNSLLLTVAPTGTVSIVFGNVSSGIEPNFGFKQNRKIWVDGKEQETHPNESFISRFYKHCTGKNLAPKWIDAHLWAQTMKDITASEQVVMQAVVQKHIDASVSKTVNVRKDITLEEFAGVYQQAYDSGCKGCTTYRPSELRGSVIDSTDDPEVIVLDSFTALAEAEKSGLLSGKESTTPKEKEKEKRPEVLAGCTYKIKWPGLKDNAYLTVNEKDGRPWEVFFSSRDLAVFEWSVLSHMMLSRCLRNGESPMELAEIFKGVQGAHDGHWVKGKYYTSLPQYIGTILESHFKKYAGPDMVLNTSESAIAIDFKVRSAIQGGTKCPQCLAPAVIASEGCQKCTNCDWSKC